ncbi:MAG: hypothetical protein AAF533_08970 [Acidobacteriota bacterium]
MAAWSQGVRERESAEASAKAELASSGRSDEELSALLGQLSLDDTESAARRRVLIRRLLEN